MKFVALQKEQFIENTATKITAIVDFKRIQGSTLLKKLKENRDVLEQNGFRFSTRRSNGKNLIKIELLEEYDDINDDLECEN